MKQLSIAVIFCLSITLRLFAQSDGPRTQLPSPTGVWAVNIKYLNLDQNLLTSGSILLKNANINADVLPITFIHTFRIGDNWARVYAMAAPVLSFSASTPYQKLPINQINTSGFSDGWVTFEMGLIGRPAQNIFEFSKSVPDKFTMSGSVRYWYSGTYDPNDFVNLGSNRSAFDLGVPMTLRLNNDPKQIIWWETWPGIQFFTANNQPAKLSSANKITQRPLLYWENHFSYNISPKFYGGLDARFQEGGQTLTDGVENDNRISFLGGGVFAGYKPLPYLDLYANYAGILWGDNGARSRMIRLSLVFSYVNTKKK